MEHDHVMVDDSEQSRQRDQRTCLRHGVLGQLAGQDEAHGRLDLTARDRRLLVVPGQSLSRTGSDFRTCALRAAR